jgi:hypothetical protein
VSMKRTEQAIQDLLDLNFNRAIDNLQKTLTNQIAEQVHEDNFQTGAGAPRLHVKYGGEYACLINDISDIVSEYLADKGILLDVEQEEQTNE